jgi:KUP system potassium uptake protein
MDRYMHFIANDMEKKGVVSLESRYPSLKKHGIEGDFRFMVVERVVKNDIGLSATKQTILDLYDFMKRLSTSDTQILDLDPTNVTVETVPLLSYNED